MADPSVEPKGGSLRLFVAIELPGEVREALSRLQHELQRRGLEKLRWVRPEGIHLTLKFLGETPAEKVAAIEGALTAAASDIERHKVALGGLGMFGNRRSPRVLWVGVHSVPETYDLFQQIEERLSALGYEREDRDFAPHLTLARVKPETALEIRPAIVAAIEGAKPPRSVISVHEVSLMRSTLRSSGAVYERVAAFPLGGA
jgi:2'-5' RNA ligase